MFKKIVDWNSKLSPNKRKILNIFLIITISIGSAYAILAFILPFVISNSEFSSMTIAEGIATIAVITTITITAINLVVASMNKRYASKKQLSLSVNVQGKKVIITSTIENKGTGRITPKSFYLFINEGKKVQKNSTYSEYQFPNILKHECGEYDCALAKKCKVTRIERIPDEILGDDFKNSLSICNILNHIASDSVNFIDPGEIFSEDTIYELAPGVYRAILVGITVETDCMCAHKIFVVHPDKNIAVKEN